MALSRFYILDAVLAILMVAIWGSNYAIAKLGLESVPPFYFMALRFGLTAIILLPFASYPKEHNQIKNLFIYSVIIGLVHFGGVFIALSITDAITVIIVSQLSVPISLYLAWMILREKIGWSQGLGVATAIIGVVIFAGNPNLASNVAGILFTFIGAAAWSAGTLWMKVKITVDAKMVNFWMSLFSVPLLLSASYFTGEDIISTTKNINFLAITTIFYQAIFIVIMGYGI